MNKKLDIKDLKEVPNKTETANVVGGYKLKNVIVSSVASSGEQSGRASSHRQR